MEEKELTPMEALMDLFDNASRKLSTDNDIDKMYLSINFENYGIIKKALEENEELKKKAQAFDIIREKEVDFTYISILDSYKAYWNIIGKHQNEKYQLTEEEWNFLKEMFGRKE